MSLLGSVFDNPAIKKAAFGQLKKLMDSEKLGMIIVRLDETGELAFDLYKPGEATVTIISNEPAGEITGHIKNDSFIGVDSGQHETTGSQNVFISPEKPSENANDQISR